MSTAPVTCVTVVAEGPDFKLFSDNALFRYNSLWHEFDFVAYIDDEQAQRWIELAQSRKGGLI